MQIINHTAEDITTELDVGKVPVKGMQSRITIRARNYAEVDIELVQFLVLDKGFQAHVAAGNLSFVKPYTANSQVAPAIVNRAKVWPVVLPTDQQYGWNMMLFNLGVL